MLLPVPPGGPPEWQIFVVSPWNISPSMQLLALSVPVLAAVKVLLMETDVTGRWEPCHGMGYGVPMMTISPTPIAWVETALTVTKYAIAPKGASLMSPVSVQQSNV